jgi:hypothetical protein
MASSRPGGERTPWLGESRWKNGTVSEAFADLGDDEITDRWLACSLGGTGIKHLDHVRIAWVLVRRLGPAVATETLVEGTRRGSAHYGVPERFDEQLTRAWAKAVADAQTKRPARDFREFLREHTQLARSNLLGRPAWKRHRP